MERTVEEAPPIVTALEGKEMADANGLTEHLRALLVQHGPAELLRAMSAGGRLFRR